MAGPACSGTEALAGAGRRCGCAPMAMRGANSARREGAAPGGDGSHGVRWPCWQVVARAGAGAARRPLPPPSSSLLSSLLDLAGGVAAAHAVPRRDGGTRRRGPCQGACGGRWQASSMVLETVSSCGAATRPRNASWVRGRLGKISSQGQNLRRHPAGGEKTPPEEANGWRCPHDEILERAVPALPVLVRDPASRCRT